MSARPTPRSCCSTMPARRWRNGRGPALSWLDHPTPARRGRVWAWAVDALAELARLAPDRLHRAGGAWCRGRAVGWRRAGPAGARLRISRSERDRGGVGAELDPFAATGSPVLPIGLCLGAQFDWQERTFPASVRPDHAHPAAGAVLGLAAVGGEGHRGHLAGSAHPSVAPGRGAVFRPRAPARLGRSLPAAAARLGNAGCRPPRGRQGHGRAGRLPRARRHPRQQRILPAASGGPHAAVHRAVDRHLDHRHGAGPAAGAPRRACRHAGQCRCARQAGADRPVHGRARGRAGGRQCGGAADAGRTRRRRGHRRCAGNGAAQLRGRQRPVHRPHRSDRGRCRGRSPAAPHGAGLALRGAHRRRDAGQARGQRPGAGRGQLHRNAAFCGLLAALRPGQPIHATDDPSGTARGAWLLARWSTGRAGPATCRRPSRRGRSRTWKATASAGAR